MTVTADDDSLSRHVQLLKVIADETRLRILGLLSERERTGTEIAQALELTPPTVSHHMRKLTEASIVTSTPDGQRLLYALNTALLRDVRRAEAPRSSKSPSRTALPDAANAREKVIRNFFVGDRLKAIPARRKERVIILQKLLERFSAGHTYPEREVNALLRVAHEDVATLRRELVDYGFMTRDKSGYQVAGALPSRSQHVAQEITGDEHAWLAGLINASVRSSR